MLRGGNSFDLFVAVLCWIVILLTLSCVGCSLFRGSRVEARADYSVFADDLDVSIVAVGYVKE